MVKIILNINYNPHKVDQAQHAHSSEISLGVISLETNVSPLFGHPGLQFDRGHQQSPQLYSEIRRWLQAFTSSGVN